MTKLFAPLIGALLLFSGALTAQSVCGTPTPEQHYQNASPEGKRRIDAQARITEQFTRQTAARATTNVITIPVVVHVVYRTAVQNISTNQILSQIAVLNEDFRKLNADVANVPAVFQGLVADAEIEFCLASRDEYGCFTTGITRTLSNRNKWSDNDAIKDPAQGGVAPWDRDQYLNIWVCDLDKDGTDKLLGYATFPGGPANIDGVVIDYTAFGTQGTAEIPHELGRTATHEVGHWLDLHHIWGSTDALGNYTCSDSDQVDDTPNQLGPDTLCPAFPHISCDNGPNGDMFMNYMDYTNDGCRTMFTLGQKARMRALFEPGGARESLLSSMGCVPGCPATLTVTPISGTSSLCLAGMQNTGDVYVTVTNYNPGCMQYSWSVTPNNGGLQDVGESISPTGLIRAHLQAFQTGTYTVKFTISLHSSCGDDIQERTYQVVVCDVPPALPGVPPYGMDYICTGQAPECYTFSAANCLSGLIATSTDPKLTVTVNGTTICLNSEWYRRRVSHVSLTPVNQCGNGPMVTWDITIDDPAHCGEGGLHKPAPSTPWTEPALSLRISATGRQITVQDATDQPAAEPAEKSIQVFNLEGRQLFESRTSDRSTTIDLVGEPFGVYVVRVMQGQNILVRKVLLQGQP